MPAIGSGCYGLVCWVFSPIPRQEFIELGDRLVVDPVEHVGEPCLRVDLIELRSANQSVHDGSPFSPTFGASEEPRLSSKRHHPFILPMSGKSWKSVTGGTRILAARLLCVGWSSEQLGNFFGCWGPPA